MPGPIQPDCPAGVLDCQPIIQPGPIPLAHQPRRPSRKPAARRSAAAMIIPLTINVILRVLLMIDISFAYTYCRMPLWLTDFCRFILGSIAQGIEGSIKRLIGSYRDSATYGGQRANRR